MEWKIIKAMAYLASKDYARQALQGLQIQFRKEDTRIVASNGWQAGIYRIPEPNENQWEILLPLDWLSCFRFRAECPSVTVTVNAKLEVEYDGRTVKTLLNEASYPKIAGIIPKEPFAPIMRFDFDAGLLESFIKLATILKPQSKPMLQLKAHGELKPFSIFTSDPNFYGLQMPCLATGEVPKWINED
jgi:DNA polymerase III sliding clamp (beta) subunit (PCNA family)